MTTSTITADGIVSRYADNIAYVAQQAPAADLDDLIGQLDTAVRHFGMAGINGHEDLEEAGTFLATAQDAGSDTERQVFLRKADELLTPVWDMTDEYRGMVGDDEDDEE